MNYMLLIHQGDTPVPGSPEWERLSPEQALVPRLRGVVVTDTDAGEEVERHG